MFDGARELIEDFAFGVLCTATWIQDHGKGWITFALAVAYGVYKLMSQRLEKEVLNLEKEGVKLDNELKKKQLEQWDSTRTSIESNLSEQVKALKDVQIK